MPMFEILSVKQHGELRRFKFSLWNCDESQISEDHDIFKFAMVRFQKQYYNNPLEIAMKKHEDDYINDFTLTAKATCLPCGSTVTIDCSANWSKWFYMTKDERDSNVQRSVYVDIELIINKIPNSTATKLYRDETHTDFQLSAEDGSVAVHRAYLAVQSDMFDTMFQGKWKETEQSRVELKGVTQQNLQDFKDFIYLRTLPDDWRRLSQLLMLTAQYLVDDSEPLCMMKLIQKITAENLDALLQFAVDNKMHKLKESILENVPGDIFAAACAIKMNAMMGGSGKDEDA